MPSADYTTIGTGNVSAQDGLSSFHAFSSSCLGGLLAWPRCALLRVMQVLFLENEDSFSWNVIESLPCDRGQVCVRPGRDAAKQADLFRGVDVVVVGPGPTDPVRAGLVDVVLAAARAKVPLLGVCLGHQALGLAFGACLDRAVPAHGKQSSVVFEPSRFFGDIEGPQTVMRYHSLVVSKVSLPLRVVAQTEEGLTMAIEHVHLPMAGLQFHPDSYGTPRGKEMIASFFKAVA